MRKVLFIDCDGVLFDWLQALYVWKGCPGQEAHIDGWQISDYAPWNGNMGQFVKDIGRFCQTNSWQNLPPITDPAYLHQLKNVGYELHMLTQVHNKSRWGARVHMVSREYGPVFTDMHFVRHGESKADYILNWQAGEMDDPTIIGLADDKIETIMECRNKGIEGFIITDHHNNRELWRNRYEGVYVDFAHLSNILTEEALMSL